MLALSIFIISLLTFAVTYLSYFVAVKFCKIAVSKIQLMKIVLIVMLANAVAALLASLAPIVILGILVYVFGAIGAVIIWHKGLNRYTTSGTGKSVGSYVIATILSTILTLILAIMSLTVVQSFEVSGDSMKPTYNEGKRVLVVKKGIDVANNKVTVYTSSTNQKQALGRVKGTPGQNVDIRNGQTIVGGQLVDIQKYQLKDNEYYIEPDNSKFLPQIVNKDQIIGVVGQTL